MKRQSKKRRDLMAEIGPERTAFVLEYWNCMVCGPAWRQSRPPVLDVHEITRGGSRASTVGDRRSWLLLCRQCHDAMDNVDQWPTVAQYALKLIQDNSHYDRIWLNRARGRDDDAIEHDEVLKWQIYLRMERGIMKVEPAPVMPLPDFPT